MTLFCASRTGREDMPSLFMSSRASVRGWSPLMLISKVYVYSTVSGTEPGRSNLLDSVNRVTPNIQILDQIRVQDIHSRKACPILPNEFHEPQLGKHPHHTRIILLGDQNPMHSRSKHLHCLCQIGRMRNGNQRLLIPQLFHIFERDGLPLSSLFGKLVEGGDVALVRMGEPDYEEEVCV